MIRTLGPYVTEKRETLGLNQKELAERCDLPPTTINRIEKGVTKVPSPDFRRRLAMGLGVSHLDILVASGEIEPEEVQAAGAEGVIENDPDSAKSHMHGVIDRYAWDWEDALVADDLIESFKKPRGTR